MAGWRQEQVRRVHSWPTTPTIGAYVYCADAQAALDAVGYFKLVEAASNATDYLNSFEAQPCPLLERERRCYPATPIHCATIGQPLAELDAVLEAVLREAQ